MSPFGRAISSIVLLSALFVAPVVAADSAAAPNFIGTWSGETSSIGDIHGVRTRDRTVHITEQTGRLFRGYFVYEAGRRDFFGVIYPDNLSFTWVSSANKGYSHGRILAADHIASCYVESGAEATAGCSDLKRTSDTPPELKP